MKTRHYNYKSTNICNFSKKIFAKNPHDIAVKNKKILAGMKTFKGAKYNPILRINLVKLIVSLIGLIFDLPCLKK